MAHTTVVQNPIAEKTTALLTAYLTDENDDAIVPAGLDTVTFTLYDAVLGTIINSRSAVDVLSKVDAAGKLSLILTPDDTVLLSQANSRERRVAYFDWTYGTSGDKTGRHEVRFVIHNMDKVP